MAEDETTDAGGSDDNGDGEDAGEQHIELDGLDASTGDLSITLDHQWVAYLASAELPPNVSGVDASIDHFGGDEGGTAHV
jgi:hypothetical protein